MCTYCTKPAAENTVTHWLICPAVQLTKAIFLLHPPIALKCYVRFHLFIYVLTQCHWTRVYHQVSEPNYHQQLA